MTQEHGAQKTTALERFYGIPTVTKEVAHEIIETLWPGAPPEKKREALLICSQYNLNPLRKHIYLIKYAKRDTSGKIIGYTWELVFGIRAKRQIAAQSGPPYSYFDRTPRAMTEAEQKERLGAVETDRLWAIALFKTPDGGITPGYGFWPKGVAVKGADKGNTPFNMACIRAESNGLDRLRPGSPAAGASVVDEQYAEPPMPTATIEVQTEIEDLGSSPAGEEEPGIKIEAGCPKCGVVCESYNSQDVICTSCGATVHFQGSTPYIDEPPAALQQTTAEAFGGFKSANKTAPDPARPVTEEQLTEMYTIVGQKDIPREVTTSLLRDRSVTVSKQLTYEKAATMIADLNAWQALAK